MTDTTTQAVTALLDGVTPELIEQMASDLEHTGVLSMPYQCAIAETLRALAAQLAAAEARARDSALDALAAYGQAADAREAQLAAEQRLATARGDAMEEAARVCDEMHNDWRRTDVQDAAAAIRALAKGGEA